jgi:hypothetical protein
MLVTGYPLIFSGIATDVAEVLQSVMVTSPLYISYVKSPYVAAFVVMASSDTKSAISNDT